MNEPLTLFAFVARVARLREAQRRFDAVQSPYNRNQVVPLALEVDALVIVILRGPVPDEFKGFTELVGELRKAQHELLKARALVADVNCIRLESAVDAEVAKYVEQAKQQNRLIQEWNACISRSVMPNNRPRKGHS